MNKSRKYVIFDSENLDVIAIMDNKRMANIFIDEYYKIHPETDTLVKKAFLYYPIGNKEDIEKLLKEIECSEKTV